jgi:hypothetical protein
MRRADDQFDNGRSYMIADVAVECNSDEHTHILFMAWVALIIYAFGLVGFNAVLLVAARKAIIAGKTTRITKATAFLYREYTSWAFWWELPEMLRRLCLIGIFVLIDRGSLAQLMIGTTYCAVHLLVQMRVAPYKDAVVDWLASVCSFSMLVFFLGCVVFKVCFSPEIV